MDRGGSPTRHGFTLDQRLKIPLRLGSGIAGAYRSATYCSFHGTTSGVRRAERAPIGGALSARTRSARSSRVIRSEFAVPLAKATGEARRPPTAAAPRSLADLFAHRLTPASGCGVCVLATLEKVSGTM